uniref:Avirulence protein AvrP123 n=1 Tax=Melampsora lini TaxID=5261 RepID=B2ZCS3_MELLI|nr:avirulence protein AvrP123 [Melampsora lini]
MLFKQCTALKFLIFILGFSIIAAQYVVDPGLGEVKCMCGQIAPLTQRLLDVECEATPKCSCDYTGDCPGPAAEYVYRCPTCGPRSHVGCIGVHQGTCEEVHPGIARVEYPNSDSESE